MTSQVQVYHSEQFGDLRTLLIDGEPWFVAKDIATALGYAETAKAVRKYVDSEDKGVSVLDTPGGKQEMITVSESGFFSLALSSKLPSAKRFKRWVTHDVLPSIRKHGMYAVVAPEIREPVKDTTPPNAVELMFKFLGWRGGNNGFDNRLDKIKLVKTPISAPNAHGAILYNLSGYIEDDES